MSAKVDETTRFNTAGRAIHRAPCGFIIRECPLEIPLAAEIHFRAAAQMV